jgi:hypothetical protein
MVELRNSCNEMSKRLHVFFWIALAFTPIAIAFMLFAGEVPAVVWQSFTREDAIAIAGILFLGSGPVVSLYAVAVFSRRPWFQLVSVGMALFISIAFPVIMTFSGLAMLGAGMCAWTAAFAGIAVCGGIRLVGALKKPAGLL